MQQSSSLLNLTTIIYAENVIGYFGSWSNYRPGDGNFKVEDIDASLYTHIIYSFFGLNSDGTIKSLDSWLDYDLRAVERCTNLKKINPKLKVMVAIGGWNAGSKVFSDVAANPSLREKFANEAVNFCKENKFDGLDMDWEYPGQRDGNPKVDKANFVLLMKELYTKFKPQNLLLSAAVAAPAASASVSYDIKQLAGYVDFINLMAYDFHASWDGSTGQNAPLSGASSTDKLNVKDSVKYWLDQGLPPRKLNLGMATYGRSFTLNDKNQNERGARTIGAGQAGPYTQEPGMLGYNEVNVDHLLRRKLSIQY